MDNYYEGFEGNPEINIYTFLENKKVGIEMWDGYFDEIMRAVQPINGEWQSLAYYYNLYEGWYDESPWKVPNNQEALKQFESIDNLTLGKVSQEILVKIIELFKNNLKNSILMEYT